MKSKLMFKILFLCLSVSLALPTYAVNGTEEEEGARAPAIAPPHIPVVMPSLSGSAGAAGLTFTFDGGLVVRNKVTQARLEITDGEDFESDEANAILSNPDLEELELVFTEEANHRFGDHISKACIVAIHKFMKELGKRTAFQKLTLNLTRCGRGGVSNYLRGFSGLARLKNLQTLTLKLRQSSFGSTNLLLLLELNLSEQVKHLIVENLERAGSKTDFDLKSEHFDYPSKFTVNGDEIVYENGDWSLVEDGAKE